MCKDLMNTQRLILESCLLQQVRLDCTVVVEHFSFGRTPGPAQRGNDVQSLLREEHLEGTC